MCFIAVKKKPINYYSHLLQGQLLRVCFISAFLINAIELKHKGSRFRCVCKNWPYKERSDVRTDVFSGCECVQYLVLMRAGWSVEGFVFMTLQLKPNWFTSSQVMPQIVCVCVSIVNTLQILIRRIWSGMQNNSDTYASLSQLSMCSLHQRLVSCVSRVFIFELYVCTVQHQRVVRNNISQLNSFLCQILPGTYGALCSA